MKIPSIIETSESAANLITWFIIAFGTVLTVGMLLQPYTDLPSRVRANEEAIRSIDNRLDDTDNKLDVLICFHKAEFDGSDPTTCSLR